MMKKKKEIMASVRMPRTHQFFHLRETHTHTLVLSPFKTEQNIKLNEHKQLKI